MPARRLPGSFVATRALSLAGTAVARGATVTTAVAKSKLGRKLDQYVSRGWLVPATSQYAQVKKRQGVAPTVWPARHYPPFHLSPTEFRSS